MYSTNISGKNKECCKMCYIVNNINNNINQILLCHSTLSQSEIVKKTVEFIKLFRRHPKIKEIDKNAKNINLSIIELIFLLNNIDSKPPFFDNYKIFFSPNFDINYLLNKDGFLF